MKNEFKLQISKKWHDAIQFWQDHEEGKEGNFIFSPEFMIIEREHMKSLGGELEFVFTYNELKLIYNSISSICNLYEEMKKCSLIWIEIRNRCKKLINEAPEYKGMWISILESKDIGNCSNNGISNRYNKVLIIGEQFPTIFSEKDPDKVVYVYTRFLFGKYHHVLKPLVLKARESMFGGCFAWSSDSRFRKVFDQPISLHDRVG